MTRQFSTRHPMSEYSALVAGQLDKVITRLSWYLFAVEDLISHGGVSVSSAELARTVGVKSSVVRRDLSQFREVGRRGFGYRTARLRECLSGILHLNTERNVAWIGAARIDADRSLIKRFREHKFNIVAIFAIDVSRAPEVIGGVRVSPVADMSQKIAELGIECAIIATANEEAQAVADTLIAAGVSGILNLTSTPIAGPPNVCVRNIDLVGEFFALAYYCSQVHAGHVDEDEPDPRTG